MSDYLQELERPGSLDPKYVIPGGSEIGSRVRRPGERLFAKSGGVMLQVSYEPERGW